MRMSRGSLKSMGIRGLMAIERQPENAKYCFQAAFIVVIVECCSLIQSCACYKLLLDKLASHLL